MNDVDVETGCICVLEKTNVIKAGFGCRRVVPMDARMRVTGVLLPIRGETEWRKKDTSFFKGCTFASPSNLKDHVLLDKCVFLGFG